MEVLQQREATSSLQSHITSSSVSSDNPCAQTSGSSSEHTNSSIAANDSLQLDDILGLDNLDDGQMIVTRDSSSFADLILGTDSNGPVIPDTNSTNGFTHSVVTSDVMAANSLSTTAHTSHVHQLSDVTESKEQPEESPQINVAINNVVCTFSTRCHLNLRHIALTGDNVELKKAQGMLNMKLRSPSATASIWSSGKITVTGASSEVNSKIAARRIARKLQKAGFNVKFSSFKIVNVLGTCSLPFGILLTDFSNANLGAVQYEPELHPGATYQIQDIKATLKIFSTGSITITAPKVENIQLAVERVFPLVYPFKKAKKIDPKDISYIEKELMYNSSSEAEMISDNSDLDLEPGEIPSTKSYTFSTRGRGRGGPQHRPRAKVLRTTNADDYGSSSDDDLDLDSDDSDD